MTNIKVAIYDSNLGYETHYETPRDNWLGLMHSIDKLRQIAHDNNIDGWINEYDLNWSSTQCANKHSL